MPSPTIFSYSLKDAAGVKGTAAFFVAYDAATETVGALLGAAAALGGLLDAVTGAKIIGMNVSVPALPDPGWKGSAVANVDIEQSLLLNFGITDSKYPEAISIPALRDTLIGTDGRPILTASGAIDDLQDMIANGTGLTGVSVNSKSLVELTALQDAAVTFRKHKRGRKAVSRVVINT